MNKNKNTEKDFDETQNNPQWDEFWKTTKMTDKEYRKYKKKGKRDKTTFADVIITIIWFFGGFLMVWGTINFTTTICNDKSVAAILCVLFLFIIIVGIVMFFNRYETILKDKFKK